MKKTFLTAAALVMVAICSLFAWSSTRSYPEPTLKQPLAELLPTGEEQGWAHEDLPLGNTESLDAKAHEILNLTDFVYRRYSRSGRSFEVYVGYWAPGALSVREASVHVPDKCWVLGGWSRDEYDTNYYVPGLGTKPCQFRWYSKHGTKINVIYWHIVGGKLENPLGMTALDRGIQFVNKPFEYRLNTRREQFLIRVSSSEDLSFFWGLSFFKAVIHSLSFTGVNELE